MNKQWLDGNLSNEKFKELGSFTRSEAKRNSTFEKLQKTTRKSVIPYKYYATLMAAAVIMCVLLAPSFMNMLKKGPSTNAGEATEVTAIYGVSGPFNYSYEREDDFERNNLIGEALANPEKEANNEFSTDFTPKVLTVHYDNGEQKTYTIWINSWLEGETAYFEGIYMIDSDPKKYELAPEIAETIFNAFTN
ncbi:hypothetical protein LC085_05295 [Bacillus tianshenii]|uniref:hypothetical protein n=1 Tax=Sutcliffiella tianshenii TaxID=1463404 RepID=UPI001CD1CEB7|nr:hypothetical protein [Bacillus tianshenii]MCA1319323.1 hypothetical protein [Bacillus tianshenii]